MREVALGDKPYLSKSAGRKAQIRKAFNSADWFVLWDRQIFSGKVYHPEPPHAQSLFLFPIVFGNNLIHFSMGRTILIPKKTIGNRKRDCAWGCARGIKHHLRKSADWNAQVSPVSEMNAFLICAFRSARFSQVVFIPRAQPHAQSLFLFPIVIGEEAKCLWNTLHASFFRGLIGYCWYNPQPMRKDHSIP